MTAISPAAGLGLSVGTVVSQPAIASHPLEPLSPHEIERAVALLRSYSAFPEYARFVCVQLHEPDKKLANEYSIGTDWNREAFAVLMAQNQTFEAIVSLSRGEVSSWNHIPDVQPNLLLDEFFECEETVKAHPEFIAACARRGVSDLGLVMVDPWSAGAYDDDEGAGTEGRRLARAMAWVRAEPNDNGYARPLEGVAVYVDLTENAVVKVVDYGIENGVVPLPTQPGNWSREYFDGREGELQKPLKPFEAVMPEGATFSVDGHRVTWHNWSLRLDFWAREGLILRDVRFDDRPILGRASMCDMVVPYGDPSPFHAHKNAFDEIGRAHV